MSEADTGARKRSEARQRQRRFQIRILESEYAELRNLAERSGLTIGSYIRSRALEKPTTRAVRRPTVQVHTLNKLQGELSRIGTNLNQLTKRANSGDRPLLSELASSLASFREATNRICDALDGNT